MAFRVGYYLIRYFSIYLLCFPHICEIHECNSLELYLHTVVTKYIYYQVKTHFCLESQLLCPTQNMNMCVCMYMYTHAHTQCQPDWNN